MGCSKLDLTIPQDYVEALDRLVEEGLYMNREEIIREALRYLMRQKGIEPFCNEGAEKNEPRMHVETKKIMNIVRETKSIMDDFVKYLINIDNRLKKVESQIS